MDLMMARATPQFALRPYLPQDAPMLADIFRASVEELTQDDYSPSQQEAWASVADDLEEFAARLGKHLTLIATMQASPVGFIALDAPTDIGLFYVHPAVAGHGVGAMLYEAVEKLSAARGVPHLTVDASDSAREFFGRRGFTAEQRNSVSVGNEWLSNTTMKKQLAAKERQS
jgi:putative acetyltransferase